MSTRSATPRPSRRWRTALSVVLIVLFAIVAPLALIAGWARVVLLDTDRYVATVAPLAQDRAIQDAVSAEATRVIVDRLAARTAPTADPTPDDQDVREAVHAVVASDDFAALWAAANEGAHAQLVAVLTGQEVMGLQTAGGRVALDLGPILTAAEARLASLGHDVDLAAALAGTSATLTLFESERMQSAQQGVRLFDRVASLLPIAGLAILIAAVGVAPRRWRAVRRAGIALAIGMVIALALLVAGRALYLDALGGDVPRDAAEAVFSIVTRSLSAGALALLVLGLAAVAVAVLAERRAVPTS